MDMSGCFCPNCGAEEVVWISTTNELEYYCEACNSRFAEFDLEERETKMEDEKKYVAVLMLRGTGQMGFVSELDYDAIKTKLDVYEGKSVEFVGEDPKIGTPLNISVMSSEVIAFYVSEFHKLSITTPQLMQ